MKKAFGFMLAGAAIAGIGMAIRDVITSGVLDELCDCDDCDGCCNMECAGCDGYVGDDASDDADDGSGDSLDETLEKTCRAARNAGMK